jgi:hypothetical protein
VKEKWDIVYGETIRKLEMARKIITEGNDIHLDLLSSAMVAEFEKNISNMESISKQADYLVSELEKLTNEGKALIGQDLSK